MGLVDSGSGVDGANLEELYPGIQLVEVNPITCITASGEELVVKHGANFNVTLNGVESQVPLLNLPLTMPIISVRKHCATGAGSGRRRGTSGTSRQVPRLALLRRTESTSSE